jgi:hypothetical protein
LDEGIASRASRPRRETFSCIDLKVVGKGDKEGGVKILEDLRTSGALADEGSFFVGEREAEGRTEEAISRLDRCCSRMSSDFVEGEDAETTETGREGDDLRIGGEGARGGARGGAKDEKGVLKLLIHLLPAVGQVVGPQAALEVS